MQYSGNGPSPGPGFGGQGYRPDPASAMKGGQGPMPMGGGGGMPGGGGPQPMPKPPGGMSGGPDQLQMSQWRQEGYSPQGQVDGAMQDLQRAQIMGADPMVIARLQQAAEQAQRGMQQWQQRQYAQGMGEMTQAGPPGIGGAPGNPSQLQQNPYLQMLLQSQLGMGGGGGSNSGMRSSNWPS
jgi:hypothetical protein